MNSVSLMRKNLNRPTRMFHHTKANFSALIGIALVALLSPSAMAVVTSTASAAFGPPRLPEWRLGAGNHG